MNLREFRTANGLTQSQLSEFLDMKKSFISKVENGREKLPEKKFRKLLSNDKGWDVSMLRSAAARIGTIDGNQGVIVNGDNVNSPVHQDNRQYFSDSPDVLRATINLLEERIKEKDAQIKEKDAQIKEKDAQIKEKDAQINKLLNILESSK
ncbi:MAG: helix-turn-helix transcriptional regulator [Bacteroidales bacterium]|nr:helix-turn-helix transcriptional regulator [Bacteroidales bacterium]